MKTNLLHPAGNKAVLARIAALTSGHVARWGTMNAVTMVQHCRVVNEAILSGRVADGAPSLKERFWKTLVLRILKRLPKGRTQPPVIAAAMASAPTLHFDEERQQLMDIIARFAIHKAAISGRHPVFGPMKTADWGAFAWVHLDHHLRQFGV